MGSKWDKVSIDALKSTNRYSCVGGPFGSSLSRKHYEESGVPVIRGVNLSGDEFKDSDFVYVSVEKGESLSRNLAYPGDLVFTQRGTLGQVALIPEDALFPQYVVSQSQMKLSVNPDVADAFFLYLYFRTKATKKRIEKSAIVGGVPHINLGILKGFEVELPPLSIQKKISALCMGFDKKITLNNQINQTLEQMAQTLFKSWFVDFDPVKAKMNGEQPKGMNAPFLSKEVASLFPEKLVESDLGLIPDGWEIHKTQDLFDVKDGTHDSPKKAEEGHYLVTSKHITKGKIDTSSAYLISDADFEKVNQRSKVDTFDILLTMIGTVGEVVVVYDNPVEFAIKNVGLFKTSQRPELVWLFYWHLQSFKMKHYLEVRMAGTTQQYLTLKTLRTIPVVLPSEEILAKFNEVMSPLMEKISDNHKQNQTLSNLRDTLLPKLLSGEIDLENVQVEQAKALTE